ncbi:MAG: DNA gyrase inhibitor YacG [Pseudomonadota bacterium]
MHTPSVPCPVCRKPVVWSADAPYRPFCSERCRLIDLGDWISENHRIEPEDDPHHPWPDASDDTH